MVVRVIAHSEEKREECGVIGVYAKNDADVASLLHRALIALQHRGQDAAGFAVYNRKTKKIAPRRGMGLVDAIFEPKDLLVKGQLGVGHTRYPTIGKCRLCDVQPSVYKHIATAHNGHIANYPVLQKFLENKGYKFESTVDSEPMAYLLHYSECGAKIGLEEAVKDIMARAEGSYSDTAIVHDKLVVFRDPHAIRPLVWGENEEYVMFASETVALDLNGIEYKGEVKGGEMILLSGQGKTFKMERKQLVQEAPKHCMFEYVYFARPDSIINSKSVYGVRRKLGEALAKEAPVDADVVVAVPDTSRTAAAGYAETLKMKFDEGLIKNRYIGRTFIMPSQEKRKDAVKLKLNPVREVIGGKRIVLVDDSIVRGTTLKEIVALVRGAGAKEVHLRITCPPVVAPCFYGVDMSSYKELIANKKSVDEICKYLGADSLAYISLNGLKNAIGLPSCTACLNEDYHSEYVKKLAEDTKKNNAGRSYGCC